MGKVEERLLTLGLVLPEPKSSYGTYNVLWQIEQTAALGLEHVYLGYWIDRSGKMAYKAQFGPHELLVGGEWQRADEPRHGAPEV